MHLQKYRDLVSDSNIVFKSDYLEILYSFINNELVFTSDAMTFMHDVLFANEKVLAAQLAIHANNELLGSQVIEMAAASCSIGQLKEQMISHAKDEARHSKIFSGLSRNVSDKILSPNYQQKYNVDLDETGELYDGNIASFICSTHVAEIRTLYVLEDYRRCLRALNNDWAPKFLAALDTLYADELKHAFYTAVWVDKFLKKGKITSDYLKLCFHSYERQAWLGMSNLGRLFSADLASQDGLASVNDPLIPLGKEDVGCWDIATPILALFDRNENKPSNEYIQIVEELLCRHPSNINGLYKAMLRALLKKPSAFSNILLYEAYEEACAVALVDVLINVPSKP